MAAEVDKPAGGVAEPVVEIGETVAKVAGKVSVAGETVGEVEEMVLEAGETSAEVEENVSQVGETDGEVDGMVLEAGETLAEVAEKVSQPAETVAGNNAVGFTFSCPGPQWSGHPPGKAAFTAAYRRQAYL